MGHGHASSRAESNRNTRRAGMYDANSATEPSKARPVENVATAAVDPTGEFEHD